MASEVNEGLVSIKMPKTKNKATAEYRSGLSVISPCGCNRNCFYILQQMIKIKVVLLIKHFRPCLSSPQPVQHIWDFIIFSHSGSSAALKASTDHIEKDMVFMWT